MSATPSPLGREPINFNTPRLRFNFAVRKGINQLVAGLAIAATLLVLVPLAAILVYLFYKGFSSLNLNFFIKMPSPPGETGGGVANSIVGSGIVLAFASAMGIPIGIAAGAALAEVGYGKLLGE